MREKHRKLLLFILLSIGLIILFVVFQPKVSGLLFPWVRASRKVAFIQRVQHDHFINAQVFWQFREMYAPGSFAYNPKYLEFGGPFFLKDTVIGISRVPLFVFQSTFLRSVDSIVDQKDWQRYLPHTPVIFQDQTSAMFDDSSGTLHIIFVKPIEEMMTANGFLTYTDHDRELLHNRMWLDETFVY